MAGLGGIESLKSAFAELLRFFASIYGSLLFCFRDVLLPYVFVIWVMVAFGQLLNIEDRIARHPLHLFHFFPIETRIAKQPSLFRSVRESVVVGYGTRNKDLLMAAVDLASHDSLYGRIDSVSGSIGRRYGRNIVVLPMLFSGRNDPRRGGRLHIYSGFVNYNPQTPGWDVACIGYRYIDNIGIQFQNWCSGYNVSPLRNMQSISCGVGGASRGGCLDDRLVSYGLCAIRLIFHPISKLFSSEGKLVGIPNLFGELRQLLLVEAKQRISLFARTVHFKILKEADKGNEYRRSGNNPIGRFHSIWMKWVGQIGGNWRKVIRWGLVIVSISSLICGWWYIQIRPCFCRETLWKSFWLMVLGLVLVCIAFLAVHALVLLNDYENLSQIPLDTVWGTVGGLGAWNPMPRAAFSSPTDWRSVW